MFSKEELTLVHEQITSLIVDDGLEINEQTYRDTFNYTCDNGELVIERVVSQADEDQAILDYFKK